MEESVGRSGGLLSFWRTDRFARTGHWSVRGALGVEGFWKQSGVACCVVNVYAPCNPEEKELLWDRILLSITRLGDGCFCLIGDFNTILEEGERRGVGSGLLGRDSRDLAEFAARGDLLDVNLQGRMFTWYRPNGTCKSRIDRAFVNGGWLSEWPNVSLKGLPRSISDHCAIVLDPAQPDWGPRPFRFINAWVNHPEFVSKVGEVWGREGISGWGGFVFKEKLKRLKEELKVWNKEVFGDLEKKIAELKGVIKELDDADDSFGLNEAQVCRRNEASANLVLQLIARRSLLAQKAKMKWIKEGDVNSKLFHRQIAANRTKSRMTGLECDGVWVEDPGRVKELVKEHFRRQFRRRPLPKIDLPEDFVLDRLSEDEGTRLIRPFSEEEIKEAVWDCESSKSPGPDGFNFLFYKSCWEIIKEDLCRACTEFHRHGKLTRGCNASYIVLIPKKEGASGLGDYRPISLIGSLYKVIAKMLSKRVREVMGGLIGSTQSAFIAGRNIADGVVILSEIIDEAKVTKKKRLIFKVDFAKAYDSIDWGFLDVMMDRMNFPAKWRAWIREGLSTSAANVLVNGSPTSEFCLERGVRQGDPLSPFLFLIVAEGLSRLMDRAVRGGLLGAVEVGREKIKISHIQYADDTLFVVDGSLDNTLAIKGILKNFELLSGLQVNFGKCRVVGLNLGDEEVAIRARLLECQAETLPINYLGVKVGGHSRSTESWGDIVERIKKRLLRWGATKVSLGGRITLSKAVLAAIPIYRMSCLRIPVGTIKEITSLQRNFLWGGESGGARKLAWIKWACLCQSKKEGGLGFKELKWFNEALLGKWIWRFLREKNNLWARVVESRYGGIRIHRGVLKKEERRGGSRGWWPRILELGKGDEGKWLWGGLRKVVGNGNDTSFWEDEWLDSMILKERFPRLFRLSANKRLLVGEAGCWEEGRWVWKVGWRRRLLDREAESEAELMSMLDKAEVVADRQDDWKWEGIPNGKYSVKSAYDAIAKARQVVATHRRPRSALNQVWKITAPFKAQALAWRLLWNRLPTRDNLLKRRVIDAAVSGCSGCSDSAESAIHLFLRCGGVEQVWRSVIRWVGVPWAAPSDISLHFQSFARITGFGRRRRRIFGGLWICTVAAIWKWRNAVIFQNGRWDYRRIGEEVKQSFWGWCRAFGVPGVDNFFSEWSSAPLHVKWKDL